MEFGSFFSVGEEGEWGKLLSYFTLMQKLPLS